MVKSIPRINSLLNLSLVLIATLFLLWSGFNNGYPIVFADTGVYVYSSFSLWVPLQDRPLGYGLFLMSGRIFHSLWFSVFLQSLITVIFLFRIACCLLPGSKYRTLIAASVIVTTISITGVSKYASWLMPDIFTSWLFLGGLLFLISKRSGDRLFSLGGIVVSFLSQNSHIPLSYCMALLLLFFSWMYRSKNSLYLKDSLKLSFVILVSTLLMCTLNWVSTDKFSLSPIKSVFYMSKLTSHGIVTKTLDRYCSEKKWELCDHKELFREKGGEKYHNWFLWGKDTPLHPNTDWKIEPRNLVEYKDIIRHSVKSYWPLILRKCLHESLKQLTQSDNTSDNHVYDQNHFVVRVLRDYYPQDFQQFVKSKQQTGQNVRALLLPIDPKINAVVFVLTAILTAVFFFYRKRYFRFGLLFALLLLLGINALVIGFTHSAADRYQGRILWLLPFAVLLLVTDTAMRKRIQNPAQIRQAIPDITHNVH